MLPIISGAIAMLARNLCGIDLDRLLIEIDQDAATQPGIHQVEGLAVDGKLDRGGKRRVGVGFPALDSQQNVAVGGIARDQPRLESRKLLQQERHVMRVRARSGRV